jgi:ABC-type nitrate/sulfonate/bicarbonate transport system substrate-binding protein
MLVADKLGLFTNNGLQASITTAPDSNTHFTALVGKSIDFILTPPNNVIAANAGGAKLRIVMSALNVSLLRFMVKPDVKSAQDLRGKTGVATTIRDVRVQLGNAYLSRQGLNPARDVTWLAAGNTAGMLAAVTSGRADFSLFPAPDYFKLEDLGWKTLAQGADFGQYPTLSLITRQDVIDRDPEMVRRVVRAVAQAFHALQTDRQGGLALMSQQLGSQDATLVSRTFDWLVPNLVTDCVPAQGLENVKRDVAVDLPEAGRLAVASLVDESFIRALASEPTIASAKLCFT